MLKCPKCLSETLTSVCGYCGNKIIAPKQTKEMFLFKGPNCQNCGVSTSNEGGTCYACLKKETTAFPNCKICKKPKPSKSEYCSICLSLKEKGNYPMPTGPTPTKMCLNNCIDCKCPKVQPFAAIPETKLEFKLEDLSDFAKGELTKLKRDTENIIKSQTKTIDNMKTNLEKAEENLKKEQNTLSFLENLLK